MLSNMIILIENNSFEKVSYLEIFSLQHLLSTTYSDTVYCEAFVYLALAYHTSGSEGTWECIQDHLTLIYSQQYDLEVW